MLRSDCKVFFDTWKGRLVYIGQPADEAYWDSHWVEGLSRKISKPDRFVVSTTKKYLPVGARVVDAGCGIARTVYGLHVSGYDAYGIDFAPETVKAVNCAVPELKVSVADVRDMSQFGDGFFDGVWSLGVVEHFYDGYDDIAREMNRLIQPGGYAFVTVPSMSALRWVKAILRRYPRWGGKGKENFYQFVLSSDSVVANFSAAGFKLVATKGCAGFKGLKDESGPLRPLLQRLYDSRLKPAKLACAVADRVLSPITFHTKLYVFQKPA